MRLTSMVVYPVKSCRGVAVRRAVLTPSGLEGDRRFMVVRPDGEMLTQRKTPAMAEIGAVITPGLLTLTARGSVMRVPRSALGDTVGVTVWGDDVQAVDCGPLVASWLSELLGLSARLVFQPPTSVRPTDPDYGEGQVSFADGFPYLVCTEASLEALNRTLDEPVPMARFRPNLVITGATPYEELSWSRLAVGSVELALVKPCKRCVMVTGDPTTGERASDEPLRTLAADHGAIFGMNALALGEGVLAVGDSVRVLVP